MNGVVICRAALGDALIAHSLGLYKNSWQHQHFTLSTASSISEDYR